MASRPRGRGLGDDASVATCTGSGAGSGSGTGSVRPSSLSSSRRFNGGSGGSGSGRGAVASAGEGTGGKHHRPRNFDITIDTSDDMSALTEFTALDHPPTAVGSTGDMRGMGSASYRNVKLSPILKELNRDYVSTNLLHSIALKRHGN